MAIIRVIRNNRNRQGYMSELIHRVWNRADAVCKWGGYMNDARMIIAAFEMVHRAYGSLAIPVHCFQLVMDPETNIQTAQEFVNSVLQYLNSEYQTIAVLYYNVERCLEATFVLNAVSYINGSVFHDNNNTYLQLKSILEFSSGYNWNFEVGESVLFNNEDDVKRYPDMKDYI